jgi:hypothetical protein
MACVVIFQYLSPMMSLHHVAGVFIIALTAFSAASVASAADDGAVPVGLYYGCALHQVKVDHQCPDWELHERAGQRDHECSAIPRQGHFHWRSEEEARHDHVVAERGFVCGAHVSGTQGSNIAAATGRYGSARTSALRDAHALESINRSGAISGANGSVSVGPPANTIDHGLHATKRRGLG